MPSSRIASGHTPGLPKRMYLRSPLPVVRHLRPARLIIATVVYATVILGTLEAQLTVEELEPIYTQGQVALDAGNPTEAMNHFDRVLDYNDQECEMHFCIGMARLLAGDPATASLLFQLSRPTQKKTFTKYTLAGVELDRLKS